MTALDNATWRAAIIGRWTARIVSTLLALLFLAFLVGEGPPPLFHRTSLGIGLLVIGLALAWKWEGLGGLLALAGGALLLPLHWWFAAAAAAGLLHLLCWARLRTRPPAAAIRWEVPMPILVVVGAAVGIFILLCANEMFGMPPLMTPAFHPPPEMLGTWTAAPGPIDARFTVNPDATVSGQIAGAGIIRGRIGNNRSWFGRLMHWRTGLLIEGDLSEVARPRGNIAGDRFTAPLTRTGPDLQGSLFLSHPANPMPLGLKLRKQ